MGLDFLSNDEDLVLSQACEEIEMNYCFGDIKLEDLFMDSDAEKENLMNFDMSFDAENCEVSGMDVDVVTKSEDFQIPVEPRFGCDVDKEEIQALIESQENCKKIPVGHISYLKVGGVNETRSVKDRNS